MAPSVSNLIRMDLRGGETPYPEFPPLILGVLSNVTPGGLYGIS